MAELYKVIERGAVRPDGRAISVGITVAPEELADLKGLLKAKVVIPAPAGDPPLGSPARYTPQQVAAIEARYTARIEELEGEVAELESQIADLEAKLNPPVAPATEPAKAPAPAVGPADPAPRAGEKPKPPKASGK